MTDRLGLAHLDRLPALSAPAVDPRALGVGMVHLGIGAFHRAHQAVFTEDAVAAAGGQWGICGVTQRSGAVCRQLGPQGGLYTVLERSEGCTRARVVGSVREVVDGSADPDAVTAALARQATHVVTLTVSEKGYRYDPATGRLRRDDPEVAADLGGRPPRTTVGQLTAGLQARRAAGAGPLTVVCCDNLHANGRVLRGLVTDHAASLRGGGDDLVAWIDRHVGFPSTMVDRIVPATTAADRDEVARRIGLRDEAAVVTETFSQWVIEDAFAGPRPAWERAGAVLAADAGPWELAKVRLLNASHSTLAYLGLLAGNEHIAGAMAEPAFEGVVRRLMVDDVTPTLQPPADLDLVAYRDQLLARFAGRELPYRCAQVAMDGSHKLPQRLFGIILERRRAGAEPMAALLCLAAWMRVVGDRRDDRGHRLSVQDPLARQIAALVSGEEDARGTVAALLTLPSMAEPELAADGVVRSALVGLLERLRADGAVATARSVVEDRP